MAANEPHADTMVIDDPEPSGPTLNSGPISHRPPPSIQRFPPSKAIRDTDFPSRSPTPIGPYPLANEDEDMDIPLPGDQTGPARSVSPASDLSELETSDEEHIVSAGIDKKGEAKKATGAGRPAKAVNRHSEGAAGRPSFAANVVC